VELFLEEDYMSDILNKVKEIIVDQLQVDADQINENSHFIDDLGADSLDTVELIMAFEEAFGIEIPEEDQESITTVGKAIEYIESHLN
jgi:acyl carrier protein